jgi:hypothetical protein
LGLFNSNEERTLYRYHDPVDGELEAQGFFRLEGIPLAGESVYYLALMLSPNGFGGLPTSLLEPFACEEGTPNDCTLVGSNFTLSLKAEELQPVPEPATVTLVASGALAALMRRRSAKRNQRKIAVGS